MSTICSTLYYEKAHEIYSTIFFPLFKANQSSIQGGRKNAKRHNRREKTGIAQNVDRKAQKKRKKKHIINETTESENTSCGRGCCVRYMH